jgi:stage IV sporulation protein B
MYVKYTGSDFLKVMRVLIKTAFFILLAIDIAVFSTIGYLNAVVSDDYKVRIGGNFSIDSFLPITAVYNGVKFSENYETHNIGDKFNVKLKAFGLIPFSTVNVEVVDELYVASLGTPFGMKLYTDGVLVIDISSVKTKKGDQSPALNAGIKKGDYIVSVDGRKVYTNEDLIESVKNSMGDSMCFEIKRDGKTKIINFCAALSKDTGDYRVGLWVRDSSAGIGTLTFYSPAANIVCGLGHGVCDEDTGEILQLNSGEIVTAEILNVTKGEVGEPGQLNGKFTYNTIGAIDNMVDAQPFWDVADVA